jgi:thioesterase domain-containing protein
MLEIAQRLTQVGEQAGLLAMVDVYPHLQRLPLRQRVGLRSRIAARRTVAMARIFGRSGGNHNLKPGAPLVAAPRVRDGAFRALARYRPSFYHGTIKFVKAEIFSSFPSDPASVWSKLADKFEVETAPGDHKGMVQEHAESVALILSRYLREAAG